MVRRRDVGLVQTETILYLVISATASGSICIALGLFFPLIQDRRLSVIPVTCVQILPLLGARHNLC